MELVSLNSNNNEQRAKELNLEPLRYCISDYSYSGLRCFIEWALVLFMLQKNLFDKTGTTLNDIDIIELNEAFAAQVIANLRSL